MLPVRRKGPCFASCCEMYCVGGFAVLLIAVQALLLQSTAAELGPESSGAFSASGSGSAGIVHESCKECGIVISLVG